MYSGLFILVGVWLVYVGSRGLLDDKFVEGRWTQSPNQRKSALHYASKYGRGGLYFAAGLIALAYGIYGLGVALLFW